MAIALFYKNSPWTYDESQIEAHNEALSEQPNPYPYPTFDHYYYMQQLSQLAGDALHHVDIERTDPEDLTDTYVAERFGVVGPIDQATMEKVVSGLSKTADEMIWFDDRGRVQAIGVEGAEKIVDFSENPGYIATYLAADLATSDNPYIHSPITARFEAFLSEWNRRDPQAVQTWAKDVQLSETEKMVMDPRHQICPHDALLKSIGKVLPVDSEDPLKLVPRAKLTEDLTERRISSWIEDISERKTDHLALPLTSTSSNTQIHRALCALDTNTLVRMHEGAAESRDAVLNQAVDLAETKGYLEAADQYEMARRAIGAALVTHATQERAAAVQDWVVLRSRPFGSHKGRGLAPYLRNDPTGIMDADPLPAKDRFINEVAGIKSAAESSIKCGLKETTVFWTNGQRNQAASVALGRHGAWVILQNVAPDGHRIDRETINLFTENGAGIVDALGKHRQTLDQFKSGVWVLGEMADIHPKFWGLSEKDLEARGYQYLAGYRSGPAGPEDYGYWAKKPENQHQR